MVSGEKKKRNKTLDLFLLLGASLFVAVIATAAFWVADEHHVNPAWLFATGAAILFLAVVGWGYRRKFRDPVFVSFFLAWLLLHVTIYLLVLGLSGFSLLHPNCGAGAVDRLHNCDLAVRPSAGPRYPMSSRA
jgi:FtsH-binding integral membrane protein